jgi:hypothetical protein
MGASCHSAAHTPGLAALASGWGYFPSYEAPDAAPCDSCDERHQAMAGFHGP